ncbi:hypothetical protein B0H17DRAFT_1218589 [Mycena rosella]|uniref:F-box domain-containing protein n=1 Tax=Mycena rosella TaxID=1033263 RepID=A0AAD7BNX2_MYCRO|nr:hypothetical protein B0H17DRAFT_1218589 [Mycena rosella]
MSMLALCLRAPCLEFTVVHTARYRVPAALFRFPPELPPRGAQNESLYGADHLPRVRRRGHQRKNRPAPDPARLEALKTAPIKCLGGPRRRPVHAAAQDDMSAWIFSTHAPDTIRPAFSGNSDETCNLPELKCCVLHFNYDVLLHIFAYLNVVSVLRAARASCACNRLAQSKHVWLAIVSDLGCRHLLDPPLRDTLLRFSTPQLVDEVKRAVFRPRTWAADSSSPPTVRRQIHVSTSGPGSPPPSEPTLLSGDKHLLIKRGTGCEIWDIAEGRRIWARDGILCSEVVAQPVHGGAELLIVLCTGHSQILTFNPRAPDLQTPRPGFSPRLEDQRGKANAANPTPSDFGDCYKGVLLVTWREPKFVLLHCAVRLVHNKILCGYLLTLTRACARPDVVLYLSGSFDPHWQPLASPALARAAHAPLRVEPIILQQVEYPVLPGLRTSLMSVHDCPLQRGSYVMSTHTASISQLLADSEESRRPAVHRYRLTLPTSSAPLTWAWISCAGTINCGLPFSASSRQPGPRRVCRPTTGERSVHGTWTVPLLEGNPGGACLSPETGALTVCSARGADVYYYE